MSDTEFMQRLAEYKQKNPEFIPEGTPEEKQIEIFRALEASLRQQRHDSLEGKKKMASALDAAVLRNTGTQEVPAAPSPKTTKNQTPDYIVMRIDKNGMFAGYKFDIPKLSNALYDEFHVINYWGRLYIFDQKMHMHYPSVNEMQSRIRDDHVKYGVETSLRHILNETKAHLESMGACRENPFSSRGVLNFSNGILDTDDGTLMQHTPDIPFDYVISTPYEKFDSTPELDTFLLRYGNREIISVLAKVLWQRANCDTLKELTIFYGPKDSGKTTMAECAQATLDGNLDSKRNTSLTLLQDLLNRFGMADIEGKLLNLGDDLPDMFVKNTSKINALVGSVHHNIEHKGEDTYPSISTAYHLFTTNNLPPLDDDDNVIWSKIRLVQFNNTFPRGTVARENLFTDTIKRQLLFRAIELMLSWRATPYRNDQSPDEVRRLWFEATSDVECFMQECIEETWNTDCSMEEITRRYEGWCKKNKKHRHMKYLYKQLAPYRIRKKFGNRYTVRLKSTDSNKTEPNDQQKLQTQTS